jgi:hypothetical protein
MKRIEISPSNYLKWEKYWSNFEPAKPTYFPTYSSTSLLKTKLRRPPTSLSDLSSSLSDLKLKKLQLELFKWVRIRLMAREKEVITRDQLEWVRIGAATRVILFCTSDRNL